jgi:hypothetical protein
MTDFLAALALVLVIEGALYGMFPEAMKKFMVQILALPNAHLRGAGITAVIIGIGAIWLLRG